MKKRAQLSKSLNRTGMYSHKKSNARVFFIIHCLFQSNLPNIQDTDGSAARPLEALGAEKWEALFAEDGARIVRVNREIKNGKSDVSILDEFANPAPNAASQQEYMPTPISIRPVTKLMGRRLALPVLALAAFLMICVAGYVWLEGVRWVDALFWTIHPYALPHDRIRDATKIYSIAVYVGVFAFQVWIAERVLVSLFHPEGRTAWRMMMTDLSIESSRDHFILCGYGQVGRTVVEQLRRANIPFVLIESSDGLYRQLLNEGILVIHGDAKRHSVLEAAGIKRARGICALIDNDADNLYITITAKSLNSNLRVITRAGQERYAQAMRSAGADDVVIPEHEGGVIVGRMIEEAAETKRQTA
jgi:TrkA-N domain